MVEKKVVCEYCDVDPMTHRQYKDHLRKEHGNHKENCPKKACVLKFENKADAQDHFSKGHKYSPKRVK